MGVFERRIVFKPFEYPEILEYKNAINHSYWLVGEWNFIGDVQDFNTKLSSIEKHIIKNALLAISQIEVSVKKFWTKLGDRFPKAEFEQVGVTFGECHVDGTEVLTPSGWIDFKDINVGDDVIQFHSNNTFSITKVRAKFEKPYIGDIYKFFKKTTATYVTPNHRMVYYNHKNEYCECEASEFQIRNSNNKIPEAGKFVSDGDNSLSFMERLRIALQADGHLRYYNGLGAEYEVGIKKVRKIKRLDWILENLKNDPTVRFVKRPSKDREGYFYYTIQIDNKYNYKEFDWVNLYCKNSQWCEDFIQEVGNWDSTRCKGKKDCLIKFGSTNKQAIDKVQMIGVAAGYRTNVYLSKKEGYILSFTSNRERTTISPLEVDILHYEGMVRCITVDSGAIITRYRNKTFIAGNSEVRHSDAYSHLLEVLGFNDDFAMLLQNPVIQGRVDYLQKYLKGAADNSNENYTLTLTLFSIFIENVSLFSQFLIIKSFNKYMNILKDVENVIQATQKEECYIEGTEVLTPSGWKDFRSINVGDDVVEYDNGKLRFTKVLHKTEKEYAGELYHFHKCKNQCVVTPNHEMVYYDKAGTFKKVKAKDFKPHSRKYIPHGGVLENEGAQSLSLEDRLKIAIQADGTNLYWINTNGDKILRGKDGGFTHSFGLTKDRKKNRLEWLLNELNIEYVKETTDCENEIYYKIRFNHYYDYKEFNWVQLQDKSSSWCKDFISEAIEWDGYNTGFEKSDGYCSTNKNAIDLVQTVAIFAGYRTSIIKGHESERKDSYKNCYKLAIRDKDILPACHGLKKDVLEFAGKVYCVTVPSGVIVTRYMDDTFVAGNCIHALFGVALIKIIEKENPSWFNQNFYDKLYRACKKAYEAECNIIDWIFEQGELSFLPKNVIKEFIKSRFNESLEMIGCDKVFEVDENKLEQIRWFNEEIYAEVNTDFFHKKPVTYSKFTKSIQASDLF